MLHVRVDDEIKQQATAALNAFGLSTADAVRLLFKRIIADQVFPLELKSPTQRRVRRWPSRTRWRKPTRRVLLPRKSCLPRLSNTKRAAAARQQLCTGVPERLEAAVANRPLCHAPTARGHGAARR